MTAGPFLTELLARLRRRHPEAALVSRGVTWPDDDAGPVTLVTSEADLARTVRSLGDESRDSLWPDATVEEAGFRLLPIHLEEICATRSLAEPLLITRRDGLVWPDA